MACTTTFEPHEDGWSLGEIQLDKGRFNVQDAAIPNSRETYLLPTSIPQVVLGNLLELQWYEA